MQMIYLLIKRLRLVLLLITMMTSSAVGNNKQFITMDTAKIATISQMYEQDISVEGFSEKPVLLEYSTADLQAAFVLEQAYFDREQISCNIGHDILWDSQDPDYSQDKQFAMTEQGLVKVSLAQGSDIYYELACSSIDEKAECKIADVMLDEDIYGSPTLKSYLIKNCV